MPSARSLAPYTTSCGKIFLTHKTPFHILPITKSKFLSILDLFFKMAVSITIMGKTVFLTFARSAKFNLRVVY